jgi:uncharacterized Rmd1/YagE family protein
MIKIPIRKFADDRHFLGMYHDGTDFRLAMWSNVHFRNYILVHRLDTLTNKFDAVKEQVSANSIIDFSIYSGTTTSLLLDELIENEAQFHFVYNKQNLLIEANHNSDNELCQRTIMFNVDSKYCINNLHTYHTMYGEFISDVTTPLPLYTIESDDGKESVKLYSSSSGDPKIYPMRFGGAKIGPVRPMSATKFVANDKFIFYYNTKTIYVYTPAFDNKQNTGSDTYIKRVTKLTYGNHIIIDVKPSPDGKMLMVVTKSLIIFYSTADWDVVRVLTASQEKIRHGLKFGAWAQDGLTFAVICPDFVQVWDYDV